MVPLHPTQLYEAAANLIIFVILWMALRRKRFDGHVFILYLFMYSIVRFLVEFLRGDADRGFLFDGKLSTSQAISLVLVIFASGLYISIKKGLPAKNATSRH